MKYLLLCVAMATIGCSPNMAKYIDSLGKDPANVCITASSPYGGGAIGRLNTPGAKLNASGGQCSMEITK
jgi:hypothetical protein